MVALRTTASCGIKAATRYLDRRTWNEADGGDGGYTAVDYTNNAIVYEEYVFGQINKSTNGGSTWTSATSGISTNDAVNFIMPFIMSPNNHNTLFAGTDRVYRTTNAAGSWTADQPTLWSRHLGAGSCARQ